MLSLESIMEMRIENSKAYYVFYEFFYKSAVGEVHWKECLDDDARRIGNDTTESFALLLLANNYKAWLYEEKMSHGEELQTEYDASPSDGCVSIVDKLLVDLEFVLESGAESLVDQNIGSQGYKKAAKFRREWLTKLKRKPICAKLKGSWQKPADVLGEYPSTNGQPIHKRERDKKRRKLMKGLKKWTGNAEEGERRFKGWSDNGHKAFEHWTSDIKTDVRNGKYTLWEKAFREVHIREQEERQDGTARVEKYAVNKDLVWEL
jgi:hypothetical protein